MKSNGELTRLIRTVFILLFKTCRMNLLLLMQFAFDNISEVQVILISHSGKSKRLFSVKLCYFACLVGFVIKKAKTTGCSFSEYIKLSR